MRNFTQNIDTLERLTGLDGDYIIEAHGSFATASCVKCKELADPDMVRGKALQGQVPHCVSCHALIKPDITFFGENLPKRFFANLDDFERADLLIVIGTSLQVQPFASLIDEVPEHVPRILINKEEAGVHDSKSSGFDFKWKYGLNRDVFLPSTCDEGISKLAALLGWEKDLDRLYTKGTMKLKDLYHGEAEEVEKAPVQKDDKEVDELADVLNKLTADDVVETIKQEEAANKEVALKEENIPVNSKENTKNTEKPVLDKKDKQEKDCPRTKRQSDKK